MSIKKEVGIIINIIVMLITIGSSWGIIKTKTEQLERATEKVTQEVDILKSNSSKQEIINQNIKETVDETKSDVKELLRRIKK